MAQRISPAPLGAAARSPLPRDVRPRRLSFGIAFLLLLCAVALVFASWSFGHYQSAQKKLNLLATPEGQQALAKEEVARLAAKVGKLIMVPTDEEPVVATILDVEKLAVDQPFYRDAKNGDKVLIYMKAQRAIIYDETQNILINVGPVNIEGGASQPTPTPAPVEPAVQ